MIIQQHKHHSPERLTDGVLGHKHSTYSLSLIAVLFLGFASDLLAAVDFPAPTTFELTSDTPKDIALADFNGDGDLDIAIALNGAAGGDAGISVVMTDGLGGFDQDQPFSPGFGAYALAAGDLNSDSFMDLAVAGIFGQGSTPQVRIFLGNGAGSFTAATPSNILSAAGFPVAIVVGNFNGDANPDLAVADSSGGVLVYLGDGTIGTGSGFAAAQLITGSSQNPRDLILDDFDADGNIDLATPSAVFLGAGDGTFSSSASLGGGKSLAVGDVNGDGVADITVVLNVSGADVLDTWFGAGDGSFSFGARTTLLATAHPHVKLAVADMDADGLVDVVASDTAGNTVKVLPGQGDGSFGTAQSFATPAFSGPVAIGDWNSDGLPDMTVGYGTIDAASLAIFFQDQPGPTSTAPGAFRLGNSSYAVTEGIGQALISVVRTGSSVGAAAVSYATADATATAGQDYTATSGTLNFTDGQVVAGFPVTILDDTDYEGPGTESLTVTLSGPTAGATLGTPSSASIVISENDPVPATGSLQFSAVTYSGAENDASVTITVTRTGGSVGVATANYATANGTATATQDYTATSGMVTFADGSMTSQTFTIPFLDDTVYEGNETVSLTLSNVTGASAGSPTSATLTITENEIRQPGTLALSSATYSVDENAGPVTIDVTRTGGSDGQVTIQYATSSGTATQNTDFTGASGTLTFADGVVSQSFQVSITDDVIYEGADETFTVSLANPGGGGIVGTPSTGTVTILENDPIPPVNDPPVAVNNSYDATEDNALTIVAPGVLGNDADANSDPLTAVLNAGPANGGLTLNTNGSFTYTPNTNFNGSDSFTYHANDGQDDSNIATVSITVDAVNDAPVAVNDPATTDEDQSVIIDVLGNDSDPDGDTLSVSAVTQGTNGQVINNGNNITYVPAPNFTGTDTFDYTITDGLATASAIVTVDVIPPPGGSFGFEFADYSIGEMGWEIIVNVVRSGGSQGAVNVDYASIDGTATAGLDYDPTIGTLAFVDGQATAAVTIPILDDTLFEGDEVFNMELSNVQGSGLLGNPSVANITILEDDPPPVAGQLSLLTSSVDVTENAGFATLTVVRSGGSLGQVSVDFLTVAGSAVAGSDYDHTVGTVIFADGQMGNRQIQVAINDDAVYEGDETFTVSLLNAQGGAPLTAPTSAAVNIMDDDPAPPVGAFEFGAAQYSGGEGSGNIIVEISRVGGSLGFASVDYQSSDGSATAPQDYTAVSGTVEFLDGAISHTVSIPITDDMDYEGDEDFALTILNPVGGATLGSLTTTTATILDNEPPPPAGVLQFSGIEYSAFEDGVSALVTVTRTGGSLGVVSIDYSTSDDSAIAGQDYQEALGTLMFADGETNQMIVIQILDDAVFEATEQFQVTLSNAQGGAQLGVPAVANVVIQDNEPPPPVGTIEFSDPQFSVAEDTAIATITVIRTGGSAGQVGVEYSSTDGSASSVSDYGAVAATLTFADGETIKTFDVPIVDDNIYEGDETVFLSLANPSGGAGLGGQTSTTLNILDNEIRSPGSVHFENQAYSVTEGGSLTITVIRTGGSDGDIAVELNSTDGTARAGSDYTAVSTVLQFVGGETSKSVTFSSINDNVVESTENLKLNLSNPSGGATLSVPADATITITDNDRAPPPSGGGGGGSTGLWWFILLVLMSWTRQVAGRARFY